MVEQSLLGAAFPEAVPKERFYRFFELLSIKIAFIQVSFDREDFLRNLDILLPGFRY